MRLCVISLVLLLPTIAFAQTAPNNEQFLQQAVKALQAQREQALDQAAQFQAQLALSQAQVSDLQKQLAKANMPPKAPVKPASPK